MAGLRVFSGRPFAENLDAFVISRRRQNAAKRGVRPSHMSHGRRDGCQLDGFSLSPALRASLRLCPNCNRMVPRARRKRLPVIIKGEVMDEVSVPRLERREKGGELGHGDWWRDERCRPGTE